MGLNKPISVGGGLTAAEVQTIIDAQTTAIAGKVDAQTNTLKTDIPSSISGGASIDDIKSALDEKLPQYQNGAVVKSVQRGSIYSTNSNVTDSVAINNVDTEKSIVVLTSTTGGSNTCRANLSSSSVLSITSSYSYVNWQGIEFY